MKENKKKESAWRAHVLKGASRVVCKLQQLTSESLLRAIADGFCSRYLVLLGD